MQGAPTCGVCCQLAQRFVDPSITAGRAKPSVEVLLVVLGKSFTLKLPADKSKSIALTGENAAVVTSIKGLTLLSYERDPKGKGHDRIRAQIGDKTINAKPGTKSTVLMMSIGPDGTLQPPRKASCRHPSRRSSTNSVRSPSPP